MTNYQRPSGGRQGPGETWQPYRETHQNTVDHKAGRNASVRGFLKALPLVVKIILVLFGGSTTIIVVVVIGGGLNPNTSPPTNPFPAAVQQQWLNDCEGRTFNTVSKCQCELSYFEQHATAQQFAQDYGAMPPGVAPPEFPGAMDCPS
jgi:hypothetical protein